MNSKQIELIQESWDFVLTNAEEAGKLFYGRLFEIAPEVKRLFKNDMDRQAEKLISLISFAVSKLDSLHEIISDVQDLGIRHKHYHVDPEHYEKVGEALLWTLEKGAEDIWTEEHKEAWTEIYLILSKTMITAAQTA